METFLSTLYSIFYFVIALGVLVFVHEFGHFLMARLSGMRVDHFALGMGYRLFGWNKISGFKLGSLPEDFDLQGNCDYHIAALPIGGSCKIAGMVDESFDTNFTETAPQPWEFRSKGPVKKALAISGGVLFNLLLAILFLSVVAWQNGETTYKVTEIGAIAPKSVGDFYGLKAGDKVLSVNGIKPEHWHQLLQALTTDNFDRDIYVKVNRQGTDTTLFADGKALTNKLVAETPLGIEPAGIKTIALEVIKGGLAEAAGIKPNDTIFAVNSEPVLSHINLIEKLQANKNKMVALSIKNQNGLDVKNITLNQSGTIGVQISSEFVGEITAIEYNFFEAIVVGTRQSFEVLRTIVVSLKQIIVGDMEFKNAVGGPVMIAKQASQFAERGVYSFLTFTAMLSLSLALINILPFPALDGGHLLIIIIEAVMRREVPIKAKLYIQQAGIVVLLSFMAFVVYNDITKLL